MCDFVPLPLRLSLSSVVFEGPEMSKVKYWTTPALATIVLAVFVLGTTLIYSRIQRELHAKESSVVAKAIAANLVHEIDSLVKSLSIASQINLLNRQSENEIYETVAKTLTQQHPDFFYGVNFITTDRIIEKIYPALENKAALGKSVLDKPEILPYLDNSFKQKKAYMTHRFLTFQGVYAVARYEPIFNQKGQFRGWLGAIISIDLWLKKRLSDEGWKDVYLKIDWSGFKDSQLEIGNQSNSEKFSYPFKLLNQNMNMTIGLPPSPLKKLHNLFVVVVLAIGTILVILVSTLLFKLSYSKSDLTRTNKKLNLKSLLLNSLVHDISSPLTSLGLVIEQMTSKKEIILTDKQKFRTAKNMNVLTDMLSSVRSLGRLEMENKDLQTKPVNFALAVNEALLRVHEQAEEKLIEIEVEKIDENIFILADEKTLINNVIPNALINAIKFSKPQCKIFLKTDLESECVELWIQDTGSGFAESEISNFNLGYEQKSTLGTGGETGSGLGLTQVKGFMDLYGGKASLENSASGAIVKLKFRKAPRV